ncbi:PilC/PilY family type IV pilus protein [Pseudoxanthomonas sp.]|jgi:type IV pilus assembly protein PilY1|uniref:PilC/PilY family type IV pilus protein n=1 Tax=Pseudoxanthomonas sp. TaxID=1871049 RepID=UPI002E13D620|nr:PilC/PilY family type IV pilus protein [Pseudoxanthomonas sp.]
MKTSSSALRSPSQNASHRPWWSAPAAFLTTLLALPVNAGVTIPPEPMTTGARIPPNILMVLDNSGSMQNDYMPDVVPSVTGINIARQAYTRNTIYYNPFKAYRPWVNPDGSEMTGGTSYTAAYSHVALVPPFNTGTINLSNATQTYYVPKDPLNPATFGAVANYWRYQILTNGTVERSEWSGAPTVTGYPMTGLAGGLAQTMVTGYPTFTVPANTVNVTITATGSNAELYYRYGSAPTTANYQARATGSGATKTISINNPDAGTVIHLGLRGRVATGFSGATLTITYYTSEAGCGATGWTNCTAATPTGRSAADERANFATWYSYHRTRFKVAKAGAGRAFSQIGTNYRVGYRNIWNDMSIGNTAIPGGGLWPTGGRWNTHPISRAKPIPVTRNQGLFDDPNGTTGADNNRTAWFQRLYSENGSGATPLRSAIWNAGNYFATDHASDGPWGPGATVEQFSCRQSYMILTTDGYRNDSDDAAYDYTGVGQKVGEQDGTFPLPYKGDNQADTLADIAMYYWKNDLRPDMVDNVPASIDDPASYQHMVTFSVSLGAAGSLDPETDLPAITAGTKSWPISLNNTASSIDDLWHAAVNGRGRYVLANDSDRFTKALQDALTEIERRSSSYSNVASTSVSPDASTLVFNASYEQGSWKGGLRASRASDGAEMWNASIGNWSTRKVFTSEGGTGQTFPTATQRALLTRTGDTFNYPVTGAKNADYIKGDTSLEGNEAPALRRRTGLLGDIINSSPAYDVDTNTLYVGANDGMLHAFNASNGEEVFAYIPNIINWGLLSTLSRGDYAHRYFVDGPIAVSRRSLTSAGTNILVGSLGRGGKGLYALDVTNPASMTASNFKWERAETPSNNMGLVLSKPLLANVNNGTRTPAVVVGNGPNSTNERAVLIVMDLDTGAVIREIDTGVGSALAPNGLSSATGVYGPDGRTLAYVYAGDMQGNVWKFDMTSSTPSAWTATRLFTAQDADGKAQPISGGVAVGVHPLTRKRWVFFGTGRYLTAEDAQPDSTDVQSMYGFIDENTTRTRDDLTERRVQVTEGNVRAFEPRAVLPPLSKGWYLDLPGNGERVVQDAQLAGRFLVTASIIPSGGACSSSGTGYINALDAFTGTSGSLSYFDLNGDGKTEDKAVTGGLPVGSVNLGNGMPTLPNLLRGLLGVGGSGGAGLNSVRTAAPRWDRASWREIRRD